MLETFAISFQLKNTYIANSVLYALKSVPLVKRILPDSLYASRILKAIAHVIAILVELGTFFVGKLAYLLLMIVLPVSQMSGNKPAAFAHLFFFLTLAGGLLNTQLFNPTKDKYYAMVLLRMDARKHTLANYSYFLLKTFFGFLPLTLILGLIMKLSVLTCLLMPLFVCAVKLVAAALLLHSNKARDKVPNENLPTPVAWVGIGLSLVLAYAPPIFGYGMSEQIFWVLGAAFLVAGSLCFRYIWRFGQFRAIYGELLKPETFAMNKKKVAAATQDNFRKKITVDFSQTSNQSGYKYFNELFMKRHSKLLTESAKKIALLCAVAVVAAVVACRIFPLAAEVTNKLLLTLFPFSLLLMYFLNRGRAITTALFMNCDHSMLTYRFYRQPKSILTLFAQRLKYIAAINLLPSVVLAVGFPLLLWVSGGTNTPANYASLFFSILLMSVFFSVHTLVMYYLLQPYNTSMEMKGTIYNLLNSLTYFVCYFSAGKEVSTVLFGMIVGIFCIAYILIALLLVYRLAPSTFKLRP